MKRYIIFLLLSFLTLPALGQTAALSGTLKLTDGTPVTHATVHLKNNKKNGVTGIDGTFLFSGLHPGKYEIAFLSVEITNKSFSIELTGNSEPFVFEVEGAVHKMNEVVVTGKSVKTNMQTSGFAVDVVETQKLAVQSVQTNELLDRTAGVKIRQDGGLGSRTRYSINGFSGDAVKIFINGVPAKNYGDSFSLSSIPPALIERIEVFKGVVPGYLAEDALGGAINIVLKQRMKNSLVTSYSFGSFNTHQWNASGSFHGKKGLTVDASAFYNYSDNDYKVWGDNIYFKDYQGGITESNGRKVRRFNDGYRSAGGKFGIGFTDVKWADRFMVGGVISNDYKEIQNGTTMEVVYGNRHYRRRANVLTLNYDKTDLFTEGLSLKLEASYSDLRRQNIDTVGIMYDWAGPIRYPDGSYVQYNSGSEAGSTSKTAAVNKDNTYMVRANATYRLHENHHIYANYLLNDFIRKNSDTYLPQAQQMLRDTRNLQKHVVAITYENSLFNDKLKTSFFYKNYAQRVLLNEPYLDSGSKEYKVKKTKSKMNESGYGFSLSYALLPNLYLLGAAERALRMPNENELFGNTTQDIVASDGLKPEESLNANLGIDFRHSTGAHAYGINATVYYRDTRNMIREIFSSREEWSSFANMESVETKGVDAELFYTYGDKIALRFNLSKFDVLFNTEFDNKGHPYNYYRTQIPNEPSFKFNGNLSYAFRDILLKNSRLSVYYNISYVKEFLRNWSNVGSANLKYIPTQYPMDLGITYAFPRNKVILNFDAKNLLDHQVYDNYGLQKPGRAFYAKLTYIIF